MNKERKEGKRATWDRGTVTERCVSRSLEALLKASDVVDYQEKDWSYEEWIKYRGYHFALKH